MAKLVERHVLHNRQEAPRYVPAHPFLCFPFLFFSPKPKPCPMRGIAQQFSKKKKDDPEKGWPASSLLRLMIRVSRQTASDTVEPVIWIGAKSLNHINGRTIKVTNYYHICGGVSQRACGHLCVLERHIINAAQTQSPESVHDGADRLFIANSATGKEHTHTFEFHLALTHTSRQYKIGKSHRILRKLIKTQQENERIESKKGKEKEQPFRTQKKKTEIT